MPKKPALPDLAAYEGESVFYAVRKKEPFKGRNVLVAGGGDSALDWTLDLHPLASKMALVHRRDRFRGAPDSVNKVQALADKGALDIYVGDIKALHGKDGQAGGCDFATQGRGAVSGMNVSGC